MSTNPFGSAVRMAPPLIGALFAALTLGSGASAETFKV